MATIELSTKSLKEKAKKRKRQDERNKKRSGECTSKFLTKEEIDIMVENAKNRKKGIADKEVKISDFNYRKNIDKLIAQLKLVGIYDIFLEYNHDYQTISDYNQDFYPFPFSLLRLDMEEFSKHPPRYKYHESIFNLLNQENGFSWFMQQFNRNKKWFYIEWNNMRARAHLSLK